MKAKIIARYYDRLLRKYMEPGDMIDVEKNRGDTLIEERLAEVVKEDKPKVKKETTAE